MGGPFSALVGSKFSSILSSVFTLRSYRRQWRLGTVAGLVTSIAYGTKLSFFSFDETIAMGYGGGGLRCGSGV